MSVATWVSVVIGLAAGVIGITYWVRRVVAQFGRDDWSDQAKAGWFLGFIFKSLGIAVAALIALIVLGAIIGAILNAANP